MKFRIWPSVVRVSATLVATAPTLFAADKPDPIPPLRPPHAEIPPGFWEQHGLVVVLAAVLCLGLLALAVWLLTRPRHPASLTPVAAARQALEPLRPLPEDGAVLSRVSQVLRRYCQAAFALPPEELTTTEFCRALDRHERVGPELAAALADFLRRCDERKFAPRGPGVPPGVLGQDAQATAPVGAVEQARQLVARAEARLAQLAQAPARQPPAPTDAKPAAHERQP